MKRTTTVNIGGQVFNMDEDAHEMLDYYLASIAGHFEDEKEHIFVFLLNSQRKI